MPAITPTRIAALQAEWRAQAAIKAARDQAAAQTKHPDFREESKELR